MPSVFSRPAMPATTELSIWWSATKRPLQPSSRACLTIRPTLPAGEAITLIVRFLGEHAQQDRIEVRHAALEELLGDDVVAELLHVRRLDLHRPPAGVVVRRDRGHALELRLLLLDPLPERR